MRISNSVKPYLLLLAVLISFQAVSKPRLSIGIRTGGSKWMCSNFYNYSMSNPEKGDRYSLDNEAYVMYQTDQYFVIEAGLNYFQKDHKERRRTQIVDVSSKNVEIAFSPMWRVIGGSRLHLLVGGTFSLVSDYTTERVRVFDSRAGYHTQVEKIAGNGIFYSGTTGVLRFLINKHLESNIRAAYKFDVGQMWSDASQYANSRLSCQVGVSYYIF